MSATTFIWLQFFLAAAVLGYAGYRLVGYGTAIAERTGLGGTFVGLALLATITSLPELSTGISAVTVANQPNLAVGDALGSCAFNLLILLMLELLHPKESIFSCASQRHILAAALGVILIASVGFGIVLQTGPLNFGIGHIGVMTPVAIASYVIALRLVYVQERDAGRSTAPAKHASTGASLRSAIVGYLVSGAAVVAAGIALPFFAADVAESMKWNTSFVGTTFLALSTSLPELAVSIAAIRLGAVDMAVANLIGSNLFDVVIIAIDDLFYLQGPLLADVSPSHLATVFASIAMTGTTIGALIYRPAGVPIRRRFRRFGWAGLILLLIYLANAYFQFNVGA